MNYLDNFKDEVFTIADAKRGDIGNTSTQYAISVFDKQASGFSFDAITVAPVSYTHLDVYKRQAPKNAWP